jgi:hypothetical protein
MQPSRAQEAEERENCRGKGKEEGEKKQASFLAFVKE